MFWNNNKNNIFQFENIRKNALFHCISTHLAHIKKKMIAADIYKNLKIKATVAN